MTTATESNIFWIRVMRLLRFFNGPAANRDGSFPRGYGRTVARTFIAPRPGDLTLPAEIRVAKTALCTNVELISGALFVQSAESLKKGIDKPLPPAYNKYSGVDTPTITKRGQYNARE